MLHDIRLFTSQPKAKFYDELFLHLDLSGMSAAHAKNGRPSQKEALLCSFIVMKCEGFSQITDLLDFLQNNLIIAHYCGFDIMKPLPSYWTFDRFLRNLDNQILKEIMQSQVLELARLGIIDTSFLGLDSTPVAANTKQNNPKSFQRNKFSKSNHPKADNDCGLGVHTASNQHNERNFEYYWGYKSHVLTDCITGLPIFELTTTADVADCTVALEILRQTNKFISIKECSFIADKGYDVKTVYNTVKELYNGDCFIPLNQRNPKNPKLLPIGHPVCDAGLAMNKDGKCKDQDRTKQKFCCPFKLSIDRDSIAYKSVYALRTECERYNSRFKSTGQERLWVRNSKSAENLNTIAHISLLAIALAAVITQSRHSYRCFKSVKRIA